MRRPPSLSKILTEILVEILTEIFTKIFERERLFLNNFKISCNCKCIFGNLLTFDVREFLRLIGSLWPIRTDESHTAR